MGFNVTQEELDEWRRKGLIAQQSTDKVIEDHGRINAPLPRKRKKELIPSMHVSPGTWLIGVETHSINLQLRSTRAGMKWKASQRMATMMIMGKNHAALVPFADHGIHAGQKITVDLVRLGGSGIDSDNLQGAMKYIRDTIAEMLGTNDNNPLIEWTYGQQQNGKVGVKVKITKG